MRALTIILALAVQSEAMAQMVFKCTDEKGSVSLQQTPCAGAGQRINVRPNGAPTDLQAAAQGQTPTATSALKGLEAERTANAISAGLAGGYPVVGMTTSQLDLAIGQPSRMNSSDFGRGAREQRIYERGGRTYYVYVEGGKVTGVQQRSAMQRPTAKACPTDLDIRNMETTASSAGLSDSQREQYMRQIRDMRSCR